TPTSPRPRARQRPAGRWWRRSRSASGDADRRTGYPYLLPGADLAGLAQFDRAVDLDFAAGDQRLAGAAAVDQPDQLQQLVELDVVALEFEIDVRIMVSHAAHDTTPGTSFSGSPAWARRCRRCRARPDGAPGSPGGGLRRGGTRPAG